MTALRSILNLESNILTLHLPEEYKGKQVEVVVYDHNEENSKKNEKDLFDLMMKPYECSLIDPNSTFNREEIYD